MASVWSASDAAAAPGGMALSNGGLTVTPTAICWWSLGASASQSSGKLYVEFKNGPADATGAMTIGVASAGINLGGWLGSSNYGFGFFFDGGNVFWRRGAGAVRKLRNSPKTPAANDVWSLAIVLTSGKAWIARKNGPVGGGNPAATRANPASAWVPAQVDPLFPAIAFNGAGVSAWTLQPDAASQTYAAPAGFATRDGPASAWRFRQLGGIGSPSSYGFLSLRPRALQQHRRLRPSFRRRARHRRPGLLRGRSPGRKSPSWARWRSTRAWGGDLAPVVTFAADLRVSARKNHGGDLAPVVTALGGDQSLDAAFVGDMAPRIDLQGLLGLDRLLTSVGSFGFHGRLRGFQHDLWPSVGRIDAVPDAALVAVRICPAADQAAGRSLS